MVYCGDCHFYVSRDGLEGDCRRTSPVATHGGACWPVVPSGTRACGEFVTRQQEEAAGDDEIARGAFTSRVYNSLRRSSIDSWRQLERLSTKHLRTVPGIGAVAVRQIVAAVEERRRQHSGASARRIAETARDPSGRRSA